MKPALILSINGTWYNHNGEAWEVSPERPHLTQQSHILSDFDNAPSGVMAVDSQPDFAAAVIEKNLRSEGMVDGDVHVLTHRILPAGGGSRVLYTAVPVAAWQTTFAWLENQASVSLLFSIEAAMLALAQRHDAVLCRIGRQFRFLVSQPSALIYLSATAFSDDPDDLDTALLNLTDQVRIQWHPPHEKMSVYWCDLLVPGQDDGTRFHAAMRQRLGAGIELAPVTCFASAGGELRTAAETMMRALSWRAAANPWLDRIAAAADRYSIPIAATTALFGIGLLAVAGSWATQTMQLRAQEEHLREEIAGITRRNAGMDITPANLLAGHAATLGFLDALADAAASPDPLGFLNDLRKAANQRVRIMRVRLLSGEGGFKVDGVAVGDDGTALSGFLAALRAGGYQANAEDPGAQAQQPGFFSYSVRRLAEASGAKS